MYTRLYTRLIVGRLYITVYIQPVVQFCVFGVDK
jgi:hypothetical protein